MVKLLNIISINSENTSSFFIVVLWIYKLDNINIIVDLNFLDFMGIPERFILVNKELDDVFISSLFVEFLKIDKHS